MKRRAPHESAAVWTNLSATRYVYNKQGILAPNNSLVTDSL